MYGGPSHVDTFDYKPKLYDLDGQTIEVKTKGRGGEKSQGRVVGPKWKFAPHGQCGKQVSTLFPHLSKHVDDIAFLHSMTADSPIHGSAMLQMNSGKIQSGSPCLGSWVNYGLGSVNENLPGFVVMLDPTGGPISGAKNWSSGYMPATYQGTLLRSKGAPILDLAPPDDMSLESQRALLDALRAENNAHLLSRGDNSELAARIASYELAWKMQEHAPEAVDLASETAETQALYGLDNPRTADFGRRCLIARRLVERGVRYVQVLNAGQSWDHHGGIKSALPASCLAVDQPSAALVADLKQRGLLDSTVVHWGGEMGRLPVLQNDGGPEKWGRDHNTYGFAQWVAGGGFKGGCTYGETDEWSHKAVKDVVHHYDWHATLLDRFGFDHKQLVYKREGLAASLTDGQDARIVTDILT